MTTLSFNKLLIIAGVFSGLLFAITAGVIIYTNNILTPSSNVPKNSISGPSINLLTNKNRVEMGQEFQITIVIDSMGENVEGYDVLFPAPKNAQFISIKSTLSDFDIVETVDKYGIYITGSKKLTVTKDTVFNSSAVAQITFKALSNDVIDFTPISKPGDTRDSNIFNKENKEILKTVSGVTINK